jgi:hypothetical protein
VAKKPKWYNYMDQQQENNYGSRRWLILGPLLTEIDFKTPLVQTRVDRRTIFSCRATLLTAHVRLYVFMNV